MKWSKYSEAIFDSYMSQSGNIIVQAVPGSGKTTNVKHLWTLDDRPTVYLVFNKAVQLEAQEKLPPKNNSAILTLNGLGHRAVVATYGQVTLNDKKVMELVRAHYPFTHIEYQQRRERQFMLCKAVQTAKAVCMD